MTEQREVRTMKAAKVKISVPLLEQVLHFPPTAAIVGAEWDDQGGEVVLTITDASFPDVEEPPEIAPIITEHQWMWHWGYPGN